MARKSKKVIPEVAVAPKVEAQAEPKETEKPQQESQGPKSIKVTPESIAKLQRVKVTAEELAKIQAEGRLVGYDPVSCEATIR